VWKSWGKVAARANPVLDNELLTKSLRQPLTNKTCKQIGPAPRRKSDYQPHWPRRIGLRLCDARGRQRGSAAAPATSCRNWRRGTCLTACLPWRHQSYSAVPLIGPWWSLMAL